MNPAYLFPILASMTWGIVYTLDQKILKTTSPLLLLAIDACITFLIFIPVLISQRGALKGVAMMDRRSIALIIGVTLLTILADFLILFGVKHLDAPTASIIEISYPFFVVLFSFFLFRTSLSIPFFIGAACIFIGTVIIIKFT
ncbi:EamA family transporter [Patescibacteria group bacterium]|nr:EamA family transporter [Patescibacteria group bacterium]MBP9710503.1 EamA family transporter [Patescibacteria group bacterium]